MRRLPEARGGERIPSEALLRQRLGRGGGAWATVVSNGLKRAAEAVSQQAMEVLGRRLGTGQATLDQRDDCRGDLRCIVDREGIGSPFLGLATGRDRELTEPSPLARRSEVLAVDSAAERRQAGLGLLIELVADDGEFVPTTTYEEIRKERLSKGEEWPAAPTLSRLYGHWLAAVRAACRFWATAGRSGWQAATTTRSAPSPATSRRDPLHPAGGQAGPEAARRPLALAMGVLRVGGGQAPPHSTLREGAPDPRLKQIRKAFGGYDSAVSAARRHFDC